MQRLADIVPQPKRQEGAEVSPPESEVCPVCLVCADAGFVGHDVPFGHPDFGKAFPCEACQPQRKAEQRGSLLQHSNLPGGSQHPLTFETWHPRKEAAAAFKLAKTFSEGSAPHPLLTLCGPCGTGKSHLAAAIAHAWIMADQRGMALYYQVERLLDEIRRSFNRENGTSEDAYDLLDRVIGCSMLVLDDLGAHKATDFATVKLDMVINERYANARDLDGRIVRWTVITTNQALSEHSPRIASRLLEGLCIEIKAADWRRRS